ncbi:MAG: methyltransferase domain-containing protein [Pseudomonadota bacterium]
MPDYDRPDEDCLAFKAQGLKHYHVIRLNDRIATEGRADRNAEFPYLGLSPEGFAGRRVLDVGANDGALSFNAERAGAVDVVAVDIEDPAHQDWGFSGPPTSFQEQGQVRGSTFEALKTFFASGVTRKQKTVYDLSAAEDGQFDIAFFYGLLYHLRHPLLAFDRLRGVCRGALCVETHVSNHEPYLPMTLFYGDDVLRGSDSNWTGPSEACVAAWMRDAGFPTVYAELKPRVRNRQRFVGFVGDPVFAVNPKTFRVLDEAYFAKVHAECARKIELGGLWRG